ncbi:MAG: glutaminyl-peptide cyclotransferase, partial [Acidobacteriota bacterium]
MPTLDAPPTHRSIARLVPRVVDVHPHDPTAFTQGLIWHDGLLLESTGLYRRSTLREVDPRSGRVLRQRALEPEIFGEGLALVDDRLVQLTWQAGIALVWDRNSLEPIDRWGYNGQGWGLTYDGRHLVMSDGSDRLTFRDPNDFRWVRTLNVRQEGRPVSNLNELEWVDGRLYANVWSEERIVRIDPESGEVDAVIDA